MMKKVQILLSTYNGESYVEEQINSLINQEYQNINIRIRDDGSKDRTIEILDELITTNENISLIKGKNVGVIKSFFELLRDSSDSAEYFSFCDQDDFWETDKISRAISLLEKEEQTIPLMYCSRTTLVDQDLKVLGYSESPTKEITFANALVQNIATGCTVVINKKAKELIVKEFPNAVVMHDWWSYIVVSAFGKVVFDHESKILYRQHSNNTVGAATSILSKWSKRIRMFLKKGNLKEISMQALEFERIHGVQLDPIKKQILNRFITSRNRFMQRLNYSIFGEAYRQDFLDNIIFKILIIINKI